MDKLKFKLKIIIAVYLFSSLFYILGIYGYYTEVTEPVTNQLTINYTTSYTVRHELMNLDGTTYTLYRKFDFDNIPIGTTVSPEVYTDLEGYETPAVQTVTLNNFSHRTIVYQYPRKQYTLTITNSEHVHTTTPSGTYYHGQPIRLEADSSIDQGAPFVRWSNGNTNQVYEFTLTEDTTIGPIYGNTHTITFEPNNTEAQITRYIVENQPIGTLPTVTYDDCDAGTGSYLERNCTYVYEFQGWYKEPNFVNKVNENFVPTSDMTLYAKWNKIFFSSPGPTTFDGTNYINTGIRMFNKDNADKDFIVTLTVDSHNGYVNERGTIFTNMNEKSDPWPGVQFFIEGDNPDYTFAMNANIPGEKFRDDDTGYNVGDKVVIKKENGIVYYSYGGEPFIRINDFTNFTAYFNDYATFGAGTNSSGNPYRYFKGTVSDMSIELKEAPSYTIAFDANGGTGTMASQTVKVGATTTLNSNTFTNGNSSFGGWNTEPDGTGTSYANGASVTGLGNANETITLYAQWVPPIEYSIHFDANGGEGTMSDQVLTYNGIPVPLTANEFVKEGYQFISWNTEQDGSGTNYADEEEVVDLTDVQDEVITLYAQYMKIAYSKPGDTVFDGTADTFIDTGVNLYTSDTIDEDFEIRFTVKESVSNNTFQATIINCKDESNPKWPGFNIRFGRQNNLNNMTPTYKWNNGNSSSTLSDISITHLPVEFVIKRTNKVVTLSYSYEGYQSTVHTLYNQTSWTLTQYFADNLSFGGIYNSTHQPDRFFNGTLSDIIILVDE